MINFVTILFNLLKFVRKSAVMGICEVDLHFAKKLKGDMRLCIMTRFLKTH